MIRFGGLAGGMSQVLRINDPVLEPGQEGCGKYYEQMIQFGGLEGGRWQVLRINDPVLGLVRRDVASITNK